MFEVYNTHGTKVADAVNPTLALRGKYTATIPAGSARDREVTIEVSDTDIPVFAIRPAANRPTYIRWPRVKPGDPTKWQLTITTNAFADDSLDGDPFGAVNTTAYNVTVYHFDRALPTNDNYGLQLFDATGRCTFQGNQKAAKVVAAAPFNFGRGSNISATAPSGRVYAAIANYGFLSVTETGSWGWRERHFREQVIVTGNTVDLQGGYPVFHLAVSSGPEKTRRHGLPGGFIIDVTGY
jgi:hypothetical protein